MGRQETLLRTISPASTARARCSWRRALAGLEPWASRSWVGARAASRRCFFGGMTVEENLKMGGYRLGAGSGHRAIEGVYELFLLQAKKQQLRRNSAAASSRCCDRPGPDELTQIADAGRAVTGPVAAARFRATAAIRALAAALYMALSFANRTQALL